MVKHKTKINESEKIDPLLQFDKHIRTKMPYKSIRLASSSKNFKIYSSFSPRVRLADEYIENINSLCKNTRQNIFTEKNRVISLKLKIKNEDFLPETKFKTENDALISQCVDFINDRKFSLKSQHDMFFTKRLQKSVTKKLIG